MAYDELERYGDRQQDGRLVELSQHYTWLVNDAVASGLPDETVGRLADEYADEALRLLTGDHWPARQVPSHSPQP